MKKLLPLIIALCMVVLSACSRTTPTTAQNPQEFNQVLSVQVAKDANQSDVEAQYNGKVIAWHPESNLAILGLYAGELSAQAEANVDVFKTPEVTAGGSRAWGGGSRAWGGGYKAWGGGGTTNPTTFTENSLMWQQIRLTQGQNIARNLGRGVKVAVIDTGLDLAHPAFVGKLAPSSEWKDFVGNDTNPQEVSGGAAYGHGTGVAGIILQVAPNVTILPLRVLEPDGSGDVDDVVAAIDWAVLKGAKIINLSLGSIASVTSLNSMAEYAAQRGVYMISSAGNTGNQSVTYPAAQSEFGTGDAKYRSIGVGSVDKYNKKSTFSTYGDNLELVAPGETIYTAVPGSQVGYWNGTSFAAPIVSGTLALGLGQPLKAVDDHLKLAVYLVSKAKDVSTVNPGIKLGKGLLDVEMFLKDGLGLQ